MGLIREGLLILACVLLFMSFLVGSLFLTMEKSLEYETLKPELFSVVKNIAEKDANLTKVVNENLQLMNLYCLNNSNYVFKEKDYVFEIPWIVVAEGSDAVINYGISNIIDRVYYDSYDCGFWECLGKEKYPFVFVSEKAKNYWAGKFYLVLIFSFILIILIFILAEKKSNAFILPGSLLIISALPFYKINWLLEFSNSQIIQFFTVFLSKAYEVFKISFIIGLIFLIIGFIFKFFSIGVKIDEFFSKFGKKEVSENEVKEIV